MAAFVVLGFLVLVALLAPVFGVDTRESRQGIFARSAPAVPAPRPVGTYRYRRGAEGEETGDAGRARRRW